MSSRVQTGSDNEKVVSGNIICFSLLLLLLVIGICAKPIRRHEHIVISNNWMRELGIAVTRNRVAHFWNAVSSRIVEWQRWDSQWRSVRNKVWNTNMFHLSGMCLKFWSFANHWMIELRFAVTMNRVVRVWNVVFSQNIHYPTNIYGKQKNSNRRFNFLFTHTTQSDLKKQKRTIIYIFIMRISCGKRPDPYR